MPKAQEPGWWKRLLAALLATSLTLVFATALTTVRTARSLGEYRWGNGGLGQVVAFSLLIGGFSAAAVFVTVETPLILLIPVSVQRKYSPLFLLLSAIVGPIALELFTHPSFRQFWDELRHSPGLLIASSLTGLFCCGVYLALLFCMISRSEASQD